MENYRAEIPRNVEYCAVVYENKSTGKVNLCYNMRDEEYIRKYWLQNEPKYRVLEVKPITNVRALLFFQFHGKNPKAFTSYKFDHYKYVLGADLSEQYRPKQTYTC